MENVFTFWIWVVLGTIIGIIMGIFIGKILRYKEIKSIRSDAVKRSQSVILGSVYEKILPFLPNFPYSPKDMVFIGKGFDYLILDGLSTGNLEQIIFLEIKSGKSGLNGNEKMIRETVSNKRVKFEELRF